MKKFFNTLLYFTCVTMLLTSTTHSMDHTNQPMKTDQDNVGLVPPSLVPSELLQLKPWIRQAVMCVSMIANFCRYCEAEDEYEINHPQVSPLQAQPLPTFVVTAPSSTQGIGAQPQPQSHSPFPAQAPSSSQGLQPQPLPVFGTNTSSSAPQPKSCSSRPVLDDASIKKHYECDRQMLEDSFEEASQKAKSLVHLLNNQSLYMIESRMRLLYGEPGVGKSTLARAIAYKAGWRIACICGRQIRGEHRGTTSIKLQQKLQEIVAKGENTIIIIDEMNRLFEEYNNSNFDTGDTAEDFWTFLDSQVNNQQLFIIGTMNNVDKLPPQFQSRARGSWIKLEKAKELTGTIRLFKRMCTGGLCVLDPSCTDEELTTFLTPLHGQWTPRDYKILICRAVEIARETNPLEMPVSLTMAHFKTAKTDTDEGDTATNYGKKHETRDQIEEKRHKDNLDQQKDQHAANLAQQKTLHEDTKKTQMEHFVRGIMVQADMQANQKSSSTSGGLNAGIFNVSHTRSSNNTGLRDANIANNLPDAEKEIYRKQLHVKLQPLIDTVRDKITSLTHARQWLSGIDTTTANLFRSQASTIITMHNQAHTTFDALQTPSVTEITTMRDALNGIDDKVEIWKAAVMVYIPQHVGVQVALSTCTIS